MERSGRKHKGGSHRHHRSLFRKWLDSLTEGSHTGSTGQPTSPPPKISASPAPSSMETRTDLPLSSWVAPEQEKRKIISKKKKPSFSERLDNYLKKRKERAIIRKEKKNKKLYYRELRRRHTKEQKRISRKVKTEQLLIKFYLKKDETNTTPISERKRQFRKLLLLSINSTAIFILAYLVSYLMYQFAVMFMAAHFGINSILYYYEVLFPIGNNSPLWSQYSIIVITFSGPFLLLVLGILYYRVIVPHEKVKGLLKLFFLWMALHCINYFFGGLIGGMITDQGFGYVVAWLFIPIVIKFLLSLISLFVLGLIGFTTTRYFLEASGSAYWVKKENKLKLLFYLCFIPWFIGSLFLFIIKIPNTLPQHENITVHDTIIYFSMIVMLSPIFFNEKAKVSITRKTGEMTRESGFNSRYLIILLVLLILFRLGLNYGLYYSLRISGTIYPL